MFNLKLNVMTKKQFDELVNDSQPKQVVYQGTHFNVRSISVYLGKIDVYDEDENFVGTFHYKSLKYVKS